MTFPNWVPDAIYYQIFPERFRNGDTRNDPPQTEPWGGLPTRENFFGGDLQGITDKLDYIAALGCNALYLNPIFAAGTNHKYDTYDYFKIDPSFGDDAAFDTLILEAHRRDIRVVLDGVFNHCGTGFGPFQDVLRYGQASRFASWFDIYSYPIRQTPEPTYATCGGAAFLPRLNTEHPEVEAFIHGVALHWLGRGIDGWRLDVPYEIDTGFWCRFRSVVKSAYPEAYLVAEEWRNPIAFLQGDTFDGATHYLLRSLALDFLVSNALTGEAFARGLQTLLAEIPKDAWYGMLTLLGSHDTARILSVCQGDTRALALLFTLLFTLPGAPLLYYGDENGMQGENDPGCRQTMLWGESDWNCEVRQSVERLLGARRASNTLRRGDVELAFANDRLVSYYRTLGSERELIVINNAKAARTLILPAAFTDGTILVDRLTGDTKTVHDEQVHFEPLEPQRAWIFHHATRGEKEV